MTPAGTSGTTQDAYDANSELSAAWYQPLVSEYYDLVPRYGAKLAGDRANTLTDATTVTAWGIVPENLDSYGYNELVACGPTAGTSLVDAKATFLAASGIAVMFTALY